MKTFLEYLTALVLVAICVTLISTPALGELTTNINAKCLEAPSSGRCGAGILRLRYYFDQSSATCKKFVYGGCKGNGNNFRRISECMQECASLY